MHRAVLFLVLSGLLLGGGCTSAELKGEQVPYPRSTPFDAYEFARVAYLEGFRSGYRSQRGEEATTLDTLAGSNLQARKMGFHAGAAHARAEKENGAAK